MQSMTLRKTVFVRLALAAALGLAAAAHAQEYPNKLVKIVIPFAPGGATDVVGRIVSERLQAKWGQPVILEHRPGAAGNIGAEAAYRAAPDGYTLLLTPPPPLTTAKALFPKLSFDPDAFIPISIIATNANVLIVNPKLNIETIQQLIAHAKAHPDRLNYASQGNGSTAHLITERFKLMSGAKITHIPYKGSGPALVDVMGGQVDMMFIELSTALSHIKTGKVRALGVGSDKRLASLPAVPALNEVLPGFGATSAQSVLAPPNTPPAIVDKISAAVTEIMRQPEASGRILELGAIPVGSTPAELAQYLKKEREVWGGVIRAAKITLD
jgi:tripartite-type tricarboxylate transporter receptor subunit TctC